MSGEGQTKRRSGSRKRLSSYFTTPFVSPVTVSVVGLVLLVAAVAIVIILAQLGRGSLLDQKTMPTLTGTSQFALFYLLAQFVERVTEPWTVLPFFGDSKDQGQRQQFARAFSLWGLASFFGIILCYITVGLFQVSGFTFVNWGWDVNPPLAGHALDSILSGVIVGGGTKPLHDLISYIQGKTPPSGNSGQSSADGISE